MKRKTFFVLCLLVMAMLAGWAKGQVKAPEAELLPNPTFAQNAKADELAVLVAAQRPISPACITVPVGRPLWKDRPTWFLIAEEDRMIGVENQRFMAARMRAQQRSVLADHMPMVTAPAAIIAIIRDAASAISIPDK